MLQRPRNWRVCGLAAPVLALFITLPGFGTPTGELNLTGAWRVTATTIDFFPFGGTSGDVTVEPVSTGAFAPLIGTPGVILDLDVSLQPVGSAFLLSDFVTFTANPSLRLDLTFISPGAFTSDDCGASADAGQTCTPDFPAPKSPFNLVNSSATSSTASFRFSGVAYDLSDSTSAPFVGEFTSQFPTQSFQDLLEELGSAGFVEKSVSATMNVTIIPEPQTGTMLLAGLGAIALSLIRRRNQK